MAVLCFPPVRPTEALAAFQGSRRTIQRVVAIERAKPATLAFPAAIGDLQRVGLKDTWGWCWWPAHLFEVSSGRWTSTVTGITWLGPVR